MRRRSGRHTDLWKWDRTDGLTGGSGDRIYRSAPPVRSGPVHFQRSTMPSSPSPKAASSVPLAGEGRRVPASGSMLGSDEPQIIAHGVSRGFTARERFQPRQGRQKATERLSGRFCTERLTPLTGLSWGAAVIPRLTPWATFCRPAGCGDVLTPRHSSLRPLLPLRQSRPLGPNASVVRPFRASLRGRRIPRASPLR